MEPGKPTKSRGQEVDIDAELNKLFSLKRKRRVLSLVIFSLVIVLGLLSTLAIKVVDPTITLTQLAANFLLNFGSGLVAAATTFILIDIWWGSRQAELEKALKTSAEIIMTEMTKKMKEMNFAVDRVTAAVIAKMEEYNVEATRLIAAINEEQNRIERTQHNPPE